MKFAHRYVCSSTICPDRLLKISAMNLSNSILHFDSAKHILFRISCVFQSNNSSDAISNQRDHAPAITVVIHNKLSDDV